MDKYSIFLLLLGSTVLSALITSVFNIILGQKNSNLQYITNERKEWRIELRKLAEELTTCNYSDLEVVLNKIKVRLNAYGIDNPTDYIQDGHIWENIHKIEHTSDIEVINEEKRKLILSLSMLLKFDWERSKKEVYGHKKTLYITICIAISAIFGFYDYMDPNSINLFVMYDNIWDQIMGCSGFFVLGILSASLIISACLYIYLPLGKYLRKVATKRSLHYITSLRVSSKVFIFWALSVAALIVSLYAIAMIFPPVVDDPLYDIIVGQYMMVATISSFVGGYLLGYELLRTHVMYYKYVSKMHIFSTSLYEVEDQKR